MSPATGRVRAAVACLLVALAPALAGCGGDDDSNAIEVGDVVPARTADQFEGGRHAMVAVPTGTLRIWADKSTDTVKGRDTRELEPIDAPDGATLVPITWKFLDDYPQAQPFLQTEAQPVVDLMTSGGTYRLPSPDQEEREGESFYVAVDGDAKKLSMKVTFDGVSQTVDLHTGKRDAGKAAALYDLDADAQRPQSCGADDWPHPTGTVAAYKCELATRLLLPYAAGKWAPEGKQFLAVELKTALTSWAEGQIGVGGAFYLASSTRVSARLDGAKPVATVDQVDATCPQVPSLECNTDRLFVFEIGRHVPGPLAITQSFKLDLSRKFGEGHPDQHTSGTLRGSVPVDLG